MARAATRWRKTSSARHSARSRRSGTPYDVSVAPSPAPSVCPNVPLIPDATSVTIIGTTTQGSSPVALITGPSASAIVALTSLTNAPPQYGCAIPFSGSGYKINPPAYPRSIAHVSPDLNGSILLARGPSDLLVFAGTVVGSGYQYNAYADDTTLGSGATLRGLGNLAFDPADVSRVLVGGTSAGAGNALTLVTGLPNAINKSATLSLPGNINSIAIDGTGTYAYVATDVGLVVVNGVATGSLSIVRPGFVPGSGTGANALAVHELQRRTGRDVLRFGGAHLERPALPRRAWHATGDAAARPATMPASSLSRSVPRRAVRRHRLRPAVRRPRRRRARRRSRCRHRSCKTT